MEEKIYISVPSVLSYIAPHLHTITQGGTKIWQLNGYTMQLQHGSKFLEAYAYTI